MRSIRREDTLPELAVRHHLHRRGLRFRLHVKSLPGSPDIVLPRRRTVVFVHGCFWHGHTCRHGSVKPRHNSEFWAQKIEANRARDRRKAKQLRELGWKVETVWECQCLDHALLDRLADRIAARAHEQ